MTTLDKIRARRLRGPIEPHQRRRLAALDPTLEDAGVWLVVPCYKVKAHILDVIAKATALGRGHRLRRRRLPGGAPGRLHRGERPRPARRGRAVGPEPGRRRGDHGRLPRGRPPRRPGAGQGGRRRPDGPRLHDPPGGSDPAGRGRLRQGQPLHLDRPPDHHAAGARVRKRGPELRGEAVDRLLEHLRPDQRLHRHRGAGGQRGDRKARCRGGSSSRPTCSIT